MEAPQSPSQPDVPTNPLAIVSLVVGILSWCMLPVLGCVAAIITGHIAHKQIRDSNGQMTGSVLATIGLVLGYLQVLAIIATIVIVILSLLTASGPAIDDIFNNIIQSL